MTVTDLAHIHRMLTTNEVADICGVDPQLITALVQRGKIRCLKLSPRCFRYDPRQLAEDLALAKPEVR